MVHLQPLVFVWHRGIHFFKYIFYIFYFFISTLCVCCVGGGRRGAGGVHQEVCGVQAEGACEQEERRQEEGRQEVQQQKVMTHSHLI